MVEDRIRDVVAKKHRGEADDVARIIYFGTPSFAVPALERLNDHPLIEVALVVTQPDRLVGRGQRAGSSPVKQAADRLELDVYQPATLKSSQDREVVLNVEADLFIVAAYGRIFGPKLLSVPRLGCLNLHASLLPKYRGASPVAAAILAGDQQTGVSLMQMETGLDTGPVLATVETTLHENATTESLTSNLAWLAADLAADAVPRYINGELPVVPQPDSGVSLTRPLTKQDGELDWISPAVQLERQVRAMWPWPRAWTMVDGTSLQVHDAEVVAGNQQLPIGEIDPGVPGIVVQCAAGGLDLKAVQLAGRRPMSAEAYRAGLQGQPPRFRAAALAPERPPIIRGVDNPA